MTPDLGQWHRLHPSSLIFQFTTSIRHFVVPGLTVLVLGASNDWAKWELYLMPVIVFVMAAQIVRYMSLRYRFDAGELVVKSGVFSRNERHIPFDRIQNIDLVQNPLHRLFGAAEVRLQTASGSEPEAVLRVLSMHAVDVMRSRVRAGREASRVVPGPSHPGPSHPGAITTDATHPETHSRVILRLGFGELVRLGIISNRGMVFVAAAMGLAFQFNWWDNLDFGDAISSGKAVLEMANLGALTVVIGVVFAVVLGAALLMLMSITWAVFRFFGFTLEQMGDGAAGRGVGFRISSGLYTKRTATVPAQRIQFVSVRTTPMKRLLGRASIRIETAGAAGNEGEQAHSSRWFVPILPASDVARVVAIVQPGLCFGELDGNTKLGTDVPGDVPSESPSQSPSESPDESPSESPDERIVPAWHGLTKRARWRMTKREARIALVPAVIVTIAWWPYGLASAILPVLSVWYARRSWARTAYAVTETSVLFRSGVFTRASSAVKFEKIQSVSLTESFFDRRRGMATLHVDTAGAGPAGHRIRVPYLDRRVADDLATLLTERAEAAQFEW